MSDTTGSALIDAAFAVCTALDRAGTTAVLTGGSAATFYAPADYQSLDLDFVITLRAPDGSGAQALLDVGYRLEGDYYVHSEWPFPLEFPPGPLMVGQDHIVHWSTHRRDGQLLHVLTPTDSVRDRLAAYLFWKDFSGLEQALAVARAQLAAVDIEAVESWCRNEGHLARFREFAAELLGHVPPK